MAAARFLPGCLRLVGEKFLTVVLITFWWGKVEESGNSVLLLH